MVSFIVKIILMTLKQEACRLEITIWALSIIQGFPPGGDRGTRNLKRPPLRDCAPHMRPPLESLRPL